MAATFSLDGRMVTFEEGQTLLDVARANGIKIPSLCYHRKTGQAARCRVCVVEVEGARGLLAACHTAAREGMVVRTDSPRVLEARRLIVNLLLSSGEHNCLACEQNGACELQDAAYQLGIEVPAFLIEGFNTESDASGEMI
ncbi:MAG TPA: 2Fe-2S iron-sulfur cluster-binding protein, partial [Polyangiaceae bacterium]|nr:2Fe-2S iron-sulfur cluster-binding protein [Polyangiaceae bacterium]